MADVLEMINNAVRTIFNSSWTWLRTLEWNPVMWPNLVWAFIVFFILLFTLIIRLRNRRKRSSASQPRLIISFGEIVQLENSILQQLSLKLSNLNDYPIQLLELDLKTDPMPTPIIIEATELLGPQEGIELEAMLPTDLAGDKGVISAYIHTPQKKSGIYHLRANFTWEPWNARFKVSALGQTVRPAKLNGLRLKNLQEKMQRPRPFSKSKGTWPEPSSPSKEKKADLDFPTEF